MSFDVMLFYICVCIENNLLSSQCVKHAIAYAYQHDYQKCIFFFFLVFVIFLKIFLNFFFFFFVTRKIDRKQYSAKYLDNSYGRL